MERLTYMDGGKWRMRIGDTEYSGKEVDRISAYEIFSVAMTSTLTPPARGLILFIARKKNCKKLRTIWSKQQGAARRRLLSSICSAK